MGWLEFVFLLCLSWISQKKDVAEPLLRNLPAGIVVQSSQELSREQTAGIARRLGGKIQRLTNSVIDVQGAPIKVNVIVAADKSSADAIHKSLGKPFPLSLQKDLTLVEYVGNRVDDALALKTSYELGLVEKPSSVRYRVIADLATIDEADYSVCNELFNQFLTQSTQRESGNNGRAAAERIRDLSRRFNFGRTLLLRDPALNGETTTHVFQPTVRESNKIGGTRSYVFDQPSVREGVSFVTATMEISVDNTGLRLVSTGVDAKLTAPTNFWPSEDPEIQLLAKEITLGKSTADEKVKAILEWLQPGRNLKYGGELGSRWGTRQFLKQRFGRCWDFSDAFVTLARASGIPSRQVAGWLYGSSGHVWAECFLEGKGWQQVDPTGGGILNCGIYHIPYFTSEDGELPIVYLGTPEIKVLETK